LFGLAFGRCFASRSTSPGAGLIWSVSCAFLLWVIFPAGMMPLLVHSAAMLRDARERFPELVAYLVCLGFPVGTALGLHGSLRYKVDHPPFRWGRAVISGGLAGIIAGLIFSRWMYEGNFFPLLAGIGQPGPGSTTVTMHFGVALLIGAPSAWCFSAMSAVMDPRWAGAWDTRSSAGFSGNSPSSQQLPEFRWTGRPTKAPECSDP
jgi:uncharacterized membrane protein YeaQ/YmgE (transglycosylase-associated protein family)